jgi:hypothetical protein
MFRLLEGGATRRFPQERVFFNYPPPRSFFRRRLGARQGTVVYQVPPLNVHPSALSGLLVPV